MKNILSVLFTACFIFLSFSNIYSQSGILQYDYIINPVNDYYSINYLSVINAGKGNTGAASGGDVASSLINPASLTVGKSIQTVFSYCIKSTIDYHDLSRIRQSHPSFSAGTAFRISKGLNAGFLYSNNRNIKYSMSIGTEEVDQLFNEHVFSIPVSYEYDILKAGIGLNFRLMHGSIKGPISSVFYPEGANIYGKTDKILFTPDFGVIINPWRNLSFGVAFSPSGEYENNWEYDTLFRNQITTSRFPLKFTAGTELRLPGEGLRFSLDYVFENTSDYPNYKNRSNIYFGTEYEPVSDLVIRAGFFTLYNVQLKKSIYLNTNDQFFLTAGGSYKYKNIRFSAAFLTSSVINPSDISHTIINFGAAYGF